MPQNTTGLTYRSFDVTDLLSPDALIKGIDHRHAGYRVACRRCLLSRRYCRKRLRHMWLWYGLIGMSGRLARQSRWSRERVTGSWWRDSLTQAWPTPGVLPAAVHLSLAPSWLWWVVLMWQMHLLSLLEWSGRGVSPSTLPFRLILHAWAGVMTSRRQAIHRVSAKGRKSARRVSLACCLRRTFSCR